MPAIRPLRRARLGTDGALALPASLPRRALPPSGGSAAPSRGRGHRGPRQSPLCAGSWLRAWNVRVGARPLPAPRQLRVLAPRLVSSEKSRPLTALRSGGPGLELTRPGVGSVTHPGARAGVRVRYFCSGICLPSKLGAGAPSRRGHSCLDPFVAADLSCLASVSV